MKEKKMIKWESQKLCDFGDENELIEKISKSIDEWFSEWCRLYLGGTKKIHEI